MEVQPVEMVSYPSEGTAMESEEVCFDVAGYLAQFVRTSFYLLFGAKYW